jgi:hypothetical protein
VYDTLLFLHLLGAFIAFVTVAMFSAWAFGAPANRGGFLVADWAWNVSGGMLLVFGVWLALYLDSYELWDGWILGALILFLATVPFGMLAHTAVKGELDDGAELRRLASGVTVWHWLRTAALVGILVLMIWKPGA